MIKCKFAQLLPVKEILLLQNPSNTNTHSKDQIDRLAKIINFQGQRSPIIISNKSGKITKGHATIMAIDSLGWDQVAVDFQDYSTEAEEYAHMTSDNEIGRWSELNVDKFLDDIKTLDLGDIDLLGLKEIPQLNLAELEKSLKDEKDKADEHWNGMPEFDQKDKTAHRTMIVHFESDQDCEDFFNTIGQKFTEKTKSVWFPEQERMDTESRRYE